MDETLIPENFKDIDNIAKSMEIYTEGSKELNKLTLNPIDLLDIDFLIDKYNTTLNENYSKIKEELFKIHLNEVYNVFEQAQESEDIYNKLKEVYSYYGITDEVKLGYQLEDTINQEYIDSSREYKTSKGRKKAFYFIHDIINKVNLQEIDNTNFIDIIEGSNIDPNLPYHYTIKTALYKEVVEETLIPLAHPLGFIYSFIKFIETSFEDYFNLDVTEEIGDLFTNCYSESGIIQTPIDETNFGVLSNYEEITSIVDSTNRVVLDFNAINPFVPLAIEDGFRLVKDYNGSLYKFDKQLKKTVGLDIEYLRISEIEIEDGMGEYEIFMFSNEMDAIELIRFQLYRVQDITDLIVKFKIKDDLPNKWYISNIPLNNTNIYDDRLYDYNLITPANIFENALDYDGKFVEEYTDCELIFNRTYTYIVITDDSEFTNKKLKNTYEYWSRLTMYNIPLVCTTYDSIDNPLYDYNESIESYYAYCENTENIRYDDPDNSYDDENIVYESSGQLGVYDDNMIYDEDGVYDDENKKHILHRFDTGYNSTLDNNNLPSIVGRMEHYFAPDYQTDLDLISSPTLLQDYIDGNIGNDEYSAREDFIMGVYIGGVLQIDNNIGALVRDIKYDEINALGIESKYDSVDDFYKY